MKADVTPTIHSFIIRFIVDDSPEQEGAPTIRGAIRHIQNAVELNFDEWQEAVEFMNRFVPIEPPNEKSNSQENNP